MSDDDTEKTFEPTPQKLEKARKHGDIARSNDLSVAAVYAGFLLTILALGTNINEKIGTYLSALLGQSDHLAEAFSNDTAALPIGNLIWNISSAISPLFLIPAASVLAILLIQRGIVFSPSRLVPKMSRISPVSNAKNKFGRDGLFEFAKSFSKLLLYSVCLLVFLLFRLPEIISSLQTGARNAVVLLADLSSRFIILALLVSTLVGLLDAIWQFFELRRRNRMSRKEITDEVKDAEGDPHVKQQRRFRAQTIATSQMIAHVRDADVVIVNPTHYSVALDWSREPGTAPRCVAKGVDEMAAAIRSEAEISGVPVVSDPPTARAIYATVPLKQEIGTELYAPVAAAIRFAEDMRRRAKGRI